MDAAALAAAIGGPAVGLAGVLFGGLNARGERKHSRGLAEARREHERLMAREARLNDRLREAYEALLLVVYRVEDIINRTNPVIGPPPPPPPQPTDDELREMSARVGAIGSEEVIEAVTELWGAQREFFIYSSTLDMLRQQQAPNVADQWQKLEETRGTFRERARALERAIRAELRA